MLHSMLRDSSGMLDYEHGDQSLIKANLGRAFCSFSHLGSLGCQVQIGSAERLNQRRGF
jgi:hypothetical protein